VTYDSSSISSGNYRVKTIKHDSTPGNLINSLKATRQDGQIIISDNYDVKIIEITGIIYGTSGGNLETNIDSFKELVARDDKNLDIGYAGGTRRYVCRLLSCDIPREFYHLTYAPYIVKFFVPLGIGKASSETTAWDTPEITDISTTKLYTFLGSYQPKPRHVITKGTRGNLDVVRISNTITAGFFVVGTSYTILTVGTTDFTLIGASSNTVGVFFKATGVGSGTGTAMLNYMDIDWGNVAGEPSSITVDEETLTVLNNSGLPVTYRGKFPSVVLGSEQSLNITILGPGCVLDQ
jgi:hypothetical protein